MDSGLFFLGRGSGVAEVSLDVNLELGVVLEPLALEANGTLEDLLRGRVAVRVSLGSRGFHDIAVVPVDMLL